MPGYPDWQRVDTRVQAPIFFAAAQDVTGNHNLGPFYVANLERVLVSVFGNTFGSYQFTLSWFNDAAMTQQVSFIDIVIDATATTWVQSIAVQAQYVVLIVAAIAPVAGDTAEISLVPNSNEVPVTQAIPSILVTQDGVSIPATTTSTFESPYIAPGPAVVHAFTVATTWFIDVQYMNLSGVWHTMYQWTFTTASQTLNQEITLPSAPVRLAVHNSDAGAHPFILTLGSKVF
jgi:hypothetical protein